MSQLLVHYDTIVRSSAGVAYIPSAWARRDGDIWEGWIEFVPTAGGAALRSARETTQPNRRDALYWAAGLTPVYLEGALARALNPLVRQVRQPDTTVETQPLASARARCSRRGLWA